MVWLRLVQGAKNGASFSSPKPMAFTSHADLMKRCWGAVVGCGEAQFGETGQIWRGFFFANFGKLWNCGVVFLCCVESHPTGFLDVILIYFARI